MLLAGFRVFRATYYGQRPERFAKLAKDGQHPRALVIACSDSRVDPALLLNAEPGELFVVRNVANLVPPHQPDERHHGTSAAIEFAVRDLEVGHIVVIGHSGCGGIQALFQLQQGQPLDRQYVNRWVSIAAPACAGCEADAASMERASVVHSLANLRTFPWIAERVEAGRLSLAGWWFDMENGKLWGWNALDGRFDLVAS